MIVRNPLLALVLLAPLMLAGCDLPGNAAPVVKLGVIAPFEGRERALGYAILPVIKETVAESNASGELGPYRVLVVAFNDDFETETARQQAEALAQDPSVFGVAGPLTADAARAVAPVLAEAQIRHMPFYVQPETNDISGVQAEAKKAARYLLDALAADIREHGRPTGPLPPSP